jgi:hypothetical protein
MSPATTIKYSLPTPEEVAGRTGRDILKPIIDGELRSRKLP